MNCVFTYDFTRTDSGPDAQKLIGGSNIEISNYNFEIQKNCRMEHLYVKTMVKRIENRLVL